MNTRRVSRIALVLMVAVGAGLGAAAPATASGTGSEGGGATLSTSTTCPAEPASTGVAVRSLGVPVTELRMNVSATGRLPDGRPVVYVQGGSPENAVQFAALDPLTGEQLRHHAIEELNDSLSMIATRDGSVYIPGWGPEALLFKYDPAADTMTNLGHAVAGESHITRIVEAADGTIYGGTFPQGHIFSFEPETERFTDYGRVDPNEQYARAIAYDEQGGLYVGTEGTARVIRVDLATGVRTEIPQPPTMADGDYRISLMAWRDGLLFAYFGGSLEWHVYDPSTQKWVAHLPKSAPSMPTEVSAEGKVYFANTAVNRLYSFDTTTLQSADAGWDQAVNYYLGGGGMNLIDLGDAEHPGETIVGMGRRGELWRFNPETGRGSVTSDAEMPMTPVTVRAFGSGLDGDVYVGLSFNNGNVVSFDPEADELSVRSASLSSQVHRYLTTDHGLYMGTYTGAVLRRLDTDLPLGPGNPETIFSLNEHNQDRLFALAEAGDRIAAGSLGKRGQPSGRLVFYAPSSGVVEDFGEVLPGHQLISMAVVDDTLYIGTSNNTPGADPIVDEALIVAWDLTTDTIAWQSAPIAGLSTISALVPRADGQLWALTGDGIVFRFDPASREVKQSTKITGAGTGNHGYPKLAPGADGLLYGSTGGGIVFVLDPDTGDHEVLTTGNYVLPHTDGRLYFARGPEVLQATLTPGLAPGTVMPAPVTFHDPDGTHEDRYTIPEVEGVDYVVNGIAMPPGIHAGSGSITVQAVAQECFSIPDGATSTWSFEFSDGSQAAPHVNHALAANGGSAVASSAATGYDAGKVIDGDVSDAGSRWITASGDASPWLEISFAEEVVVDTVTLQQYTGYELGDYDISARIDGEWMRVAEVHGNTEIRPVHRFEPVAATGVRIDGFTSRDGRVRLFEVEVTCEAEAGCDGAEPAEPPVTTSSYVGENHVVVELSAEAGTSEVMRTEYRVGGGEWVTYAEPFEVKRSERQTLQYRSIGADDVVEETRCVTFSPGGGRVDIATTAPLATCEGGDGDDG
ncbi:streptogramin lyase [Microbacterium sp. W4I4]|uniref:discoidin domain-containing protein n=1 Tax=Microbacterium sp. W4I4 TaxID=3042295 RepID=UPI00277DAEC2|nr:discoidin domain-containing protein [Microbacterium sp. W4I4]MDQ0614481.1 streptogramin lyase [Microbacterium sp. W4I4]